MRVQPITNQNNDKIRFRGTVSPEFVKYVNELRQDCLKTLPKRESEQVNKTCDSILKTSAEVMEKCFHPFSVLTINKTKWTRCDTIEIPSIITKHMDGHTPSASFIPMKGQISPQKRLDQLSYFINSNFTFSEAVAQELHVFGGLIFLISKSDNDSYIKEAAKDALDLLKWWKEHISLLPKDTTGNHNNIDSYANYCNSTLSELTKHIEHLKNASKETSKENK